MQWASLHAICDQEAHPHVKIGALYESPLMQSSEVKQAYDPKQCTTQLESDVDETRRRSTVHIFQI